MGTVRRLIIAYILKYLLEFIIDIECIECDTLYHLSMTCIAVYNLPFNSNCRIFAAELNCTFIKVSIQANKNLFYFFS